MPDITSASQSYATSDVHRRHSAVEGGKKNDFIHVERTVSGDSKEHADFNRIDGELAKYAEGTAIVITPEENKRLKRMIDKRVLTVMVFTYFLQALDKGTLSFASIMGISASISIDNKYNDIDTGIQKDAGLHGQQVWLTLKHMIGRQLITVSVFLAYYLYLPRHSSCRISAELAHSACTDCKIPGSLHRAVGNHIDTPCGLPQLHWSRHRSYTAWYLRVGLSA